MRVTVCELSDDELKFEQDWHDLKSYVRKKPTDLLLLPELPFCQWVASNEIKDEQLLNASIEKHEARIGDLHSLNIPMVVYSKPMRSGNYLHNTTFLWEQNSGEHKLHSKYYFPEEEHFWEETWYDREPKNFEVFEINKIKIGVLMCTEVWFTEHARYYGEKDVDLLLCPRATSKASVEQWIRCGQTLGLFRVRSA